MAEVVLETMSAQPPDVVSLGTGPRSKLWLRTIPMAGLGLIWWLRENASLSPAGGRWGMRGRLPVLGSNRPGRKQMFPFLFPQYHQSLQGRWGYKQRKRRVCWGGSPKMGLAQRTWADLGVDF